MPKAMTAPLGFIALISLSTSLDAQTAGIGPSRVPPQQTPEYARAYAECHNLALRLGQNVSRGDDVSRADFIDQCLAGKLRVNSRTPSR